MAQVAIIMGSASDYPVMKAAKEILDFFGYDSFKNFVMENSINVSVTTLKAYGKNKGWVVVDKIKQK